jgi:hypothetical protein
MIGARTYPQLKCAASWVSAAVTGKGGAARAELRRNTYTLSCFQITQQRGGLHLNGGTVLGQSVTSLLSALAVQAGLSDEVAAFSRES